MELNHILTLRTNSGYKMEEYPRDFIREISRVLTGLHYKMNKTDLTVGGVKIGTCQSPRLDSEKSLYVLSKGQLVEFNPHLNDFEDKFLNSKKEEFDELFTFVETIYKKVLEIKGVKEEEKVEADTKFGIVPEDILGIKLKNSKHATLGDVIAEKEKEYAETKLQESTLTDVEIQVLKNTLRPTDKEAYDEFVQLNADIINQRLTEMTNDEPVAEIEPPLEIKEEIKEQIPELDKEVEPVVEKKTTTRKTTTSKTPSKTTKTTKTTKTSSTKKSK